jgi:hypothetical protein
MQRVIAVRVKTTNDTNGNPRRGWVIASAENGETVAFIDEGYAGDRALHVSLAGWYGEYECTVTGALQVTPGQYRDLKRAKLPVGGNA